jgi:hypothetical protein
MARMPAPGSSRRRVDLRLLAGLALCLVYVLPIYVPPGPGWAVPPSADTPIIERVFPVVPGWWVIGRLLALLLGALLVTWTTRQAPLPMPPSPAPVAPEPGPLASWCALAAALLHVASLPWVRSLPPAGQGIFILWVFVPSSILLGSRWRAWLAPPGLTGRVARWPPALLVSLALVTAWGIVRFAVSWHSPLAADCVDMFRTLGGLVRLATTDANVLTESMGVTEGVGDIEVVGVNAVQLFFSGLPLLRLFSHVPCLTWMQAFNVFWIAVAALVVARIGRVIAGGELRPVVVAAFLSSPFILMCQLLPIPLVAIPAVCLLVLLPLEFARSASPIVLVLLGAVGGFTVTLPSLTLMTGVAGLFVLWRLWVGPRPPWIAVATGAASFVAICMPNIPSGEALAAAYDWYVLKDWPMGVGEAALQAQLSPTEGHWTRAQPPGTLLLMISTLLSPFATPRNSLRGWGDTVFEPVGAALSAIGLLVCLRAATRHANARLLLVFLAASLIPGFVSSYDRPSLTRVYGSIVPLCILSGLGFASVLDALRVSRLRAWPVGLASVGILASGMVLFDVVNARILSQSTFGLLMRSVDVGLLDRVAMLTSSGEALHPPGVDPRVSGREDWQWEADWLRYYHPYVDDLARCAPRRAIPIVAIEQWGEVENYDLLFWGPALEQTIAIGQRRICGKWPDATVYSLTDRAGLSRVYAVQIGGEPWTPALPRSQWATTSCRTYEPDPVWAIWDARAARGPDAAAPR